MEEIPLRNHRERETRPTSYPKTGSTSIDVTTLESSTLIHHHIHNPLHPRLNLIPRRFFCLENPVQGRLTFSRTIPSQLNVVGLLDERLLVDQVVFRKFVQHDHDLIHQPLLLVSCIHRNDLHEDRETIPLIRLNSTNRGECSLSVTTPLTRLQDPRETEGPVVAGLDAKKGDCGGARPAA